MALQFSKTIFGPSAQTFKTGSTTNFNAPKNIGDSFAEVEIIATKDNWPVLGADANGNFQPVVTLEIWQDPAGGTNFAYRGFVWSNGADPSQPLQGRWPVTPGASYQARVIVATVPGVNSIASTITVNGYVNA